MKDKIISFIVPVYNSEKYLEKCLDNILSISDFRYELIILNDESPDNSKLIIERYAQQYPEIIRFFDLSHKGISEVRNFAISKAEGEYIVFIDGDDYIDSENMSKLATQITKMCSLPEVVTFGYNKVDSNYQIYFTRAPQCREKLQQGDDYVFESLQDKHFQWFSVTYLYRTDFMLANHFAYPEGKIYEDAYLVPRILTAANMVYASDLIIYNYKTDNIGSLTSRKDYGAICDMLYVAEENTKYFESSGLKSAELILESMSSLYILAMRSITDKLTADEQATLISRLKADKYIVYHAKYFPRVMVGWAVKLLGVKATIKLLKVG